MVDGWDTTTFGARLWNDLPAEAVKYVKRIEELKIEKKNKKQLGKMIYLRLVTNIK